MSVSSSISTISVRRGVANCSLHLDQLAAHDLEQLGRATPGFEVVGDLLGELAQLLGDLVALQPGQALQAQIEDGARLRLGQPVGALGRHRAAGLVDQRDQRRHVARPARRAPSGARAPSAGSGARRISAITSSILATAMARPTSTWARSRALRELEERAPRDDLLAEGDEGLAACSFRFISSRPAAVERQHVDAEAGLQRRVAVELVQHHLGAWRRASARSPRARRRGRSRRAGRRCPRCSSRAPPRRCARPCAPCSPGRGSR